MTKTKVQLILRTTGISNLGYQGGNTTPVERTVDYEATNGYINIKQSRMIWRRVNLRSTLGTLYKEGATYILKLDSITFGLTSNLSTFSANENDRHFNIFIKGLPFLRTYSASTGVVSEALLASVRVPTGAQNYVFTYNHSNELCFQITPGQSVESVDVEIQFRDLLLNTQDPTNTMTVGYPHSQYVFSVYECDE